MKCKSPIIYTKKSFFFLKKRANENIKNFFNRPFVVNRDIKLKLIWSAPSHHTGGHRVCCIVYTQFLRLFYNFWKTNQRTIAYIQNRYLQNVCDYTRTHSALIRIKRKRLKLESHHIWNARALAKNRFGNVLTTSLTTMCITRAATYLGLEVLRGTIFVQQQPTDGRVVPITFSV